jgi:tRNA threonylcarbamoyladenosine biosynthesis protein TsaB
VIILALDTSLAACSAAVMAGERVLASRSEPMARGHQERLALLAAEVMDESGMYFDKLDRIGVTTGPGSFTGLRVGMAFAKGLSLALGVPAVGVGTLEAMAASVRPRDAVKEVIAAVVDARRDQVYLQVFREGRAWDEPQALTAEDAVVELGLIAGDRHIQLAGSGAALIAPRLPRAHLSGVETPDPVVLARLAASREPAPLTPIYLRAPDARLPA